MRIRTVFAAGVAAAALSTTAAVGQFAGDRQPVARPPALPGGLQPLAPTPQPPSYPGTVQRATYGDPVAPAEQPPHPWAVKPENGAWMICVKSYVGPKARTLAELLCREIRENHKVACYVFEKNGEDKKRERELTEAVRRKAEDDAKPFLMAIEQAKKKAEQDGTVFTPSPVKVKVPRPVTPTPDQWAVLIGGFPDADSARKALDRVRKLPVPKNTDLLDVTTITNHMEKPGDKPVTATATAYINPFASALVVPNPSGKHAAEDKSKLEPFVVGLNKDVPHSLLAVKKPWTLLVKSYTTPMRLNGKEGGGGSVFDKGGGLFGKKSMLDLTAGQATQLCESLRHKDMRPAPLESYILHHRTGSVVTVGQFDTPDDPELLKLQQTLRGMTFNVKDDKTGTTTTERMFDGVSPFPVPRQ